VLELLWVDRNPMKSKQARQGNKTRIVSLSGFSFQRHVASIPLSAEHIRTPVRWHGRRNP
jgi:hypothetical protein